MHIYVLYINIPLHLLNLTLTNSLTHRQTHTQGNSSQLPLTLPVLSLHLQTDCVWNVRKRIKCAKQKYNSHCSRACLSFMARTGLWLPSCNRLCTLCRPRQWISQGPLWHLRFLTLSWSDCLKNNSLLVSKCFTSNCVELLTNTVIWHCNL